MGRKRNDVKIRLMGECLDAGLTAQEAADLLGIPRSTARTYAWAHKFPAHYEAWRQRERERALERGKKIPRPPRQPGFWNEERLQTLKQLREAKKTFAQCAEKLGCTRNMVAGALNRRGWTSPLFPPHYARRILGVARNCA